MPDQTLTRFSWGAALIGLPSIGLFATSVWGYRQGWLPVLRALDVAGWGVWAALAGTLLSLATLIHWLRRRGGGLGPALLGLALSMPVLAAGLVWTYAERTTPPINDISTDIEDPPVFWFTATPSDYPVANAAPQRAAYPELRALELKLPLDSAFGLALGLVEERGWEVLSADPDEAQIEAIATSRLYGFKDEVAIRISETDTGTRIDLRSRSRIGRIDRGANARRIDAFLSDLETRATK